MGGLDLTGKMVAEVVIVSYTWEGRGQIYVCVGAVLMVIVKALLSRFPLQGSLAGLETPPELA
jgi:hypothetical protein